MEEVLHSHGRKAQNGGKWHPKNDWTWDKAAPDSSSWRFQVLGGCPPHCLGSRVWNNSWKNPTGVVVLAKQP